MALPTPLLALGFGNPLLLWGLAAASLPVLLHLLNRRRYRELPWAATRFLLSAIRKNQRRIRIEQWLLLAVRTLLIVCLVLGLSQPFLEQIGGLPLLAGQRTHRIVLLDSSMSMATTRAGRSRFDKAIEQADTYIRNARRGDVVSLVLMGSPPRIIVGEPSGNLNEVRDELKQLTPSDGPIRLAPSFRAVAEVMEASAGDRKELLTITDLQARSWNVSSEESQEVEKILKSFDEKKVTSIIVDVGETQVANLALTDLRLSSPFVTVNGPPAIVTATLRHFGSEPPGEARVRLYIDGRQSAEEVVRLTTNGEAQVSFPARIDSRGEHLLEVRIGDDALTPDDSRRYALTVRDSLRVLLVDGDYNPEPFSADTDYLAQALQPAEGSDRTPSSIQVEVITDARLGSQDLENFDVLVLANVSQVDPRIAARLSAFLDQGGGLIVFGGNRIVADSYNRLTYREDTPLLPAAFGAVVGSEPTPADPGAPFDLLGFKHPIVSAYAGATDLVLAGLTAVRTWRHYSLTLPADSSAVIAMKYADGSPAVIEARRGRGLVLQMASTADADWTSWPLHPSYPPVMEQVVLHAASGRQLDRNVLAGQPLGAPFPASARTTPVSVVLPSGEVRTASLNAEPTGAFLDFNETERAGSYEVRLGPPLARNLLFSVNPDPDESDPTRTDEPTLKQQFPGWPFFLLNGSSDLSGADTGRASRRGQLHRPLLMAVLGLLLFESFLAWRLGSRR